MMDHNNYQIMTTNSDLSADKNQNHKETINYHLNGQEQVTEFLHKFISFFKYHEKYINTKLIS